MHHPFPRVLPLALLSGALSISLVAQEKPAEDANLEAELMALLNTPVTVAGKKAQKISEAPAIISVLTAEDLERMGVTNLYDALSTLPGINLTETFYGYTSVGVRGNLQAHYNNKVLLLINNHPAYDTAVGSFYLEQVPLRMVERIEVLRGPGSTLYGTNAFTGVIKVVTKKKPQTGKGALELRGGSFNQMGLEATVGETSGDFTFSAGGSYSGSAGYPFKVIRDENGRAGTIDYRNNVGNAFLTAEVAGYSVNLNAWQQCRDKFGLIPTLVSTGPRFQEGFGLDLAKTWTLAEQLSLSLSAYGDQIQKSENIAWYPPAFSSYQTGTGEPERQEYKNRKMGGDLQLAWSPAETLRLIGGIFYEKQHTGPYPFYNAITNQISALKTSAYLDPHDGYDSGAFLQADGRIFGKLGMVAGVRVNKNSVYGTKTTPSAGLVFNPTNALAFKLLYGRAFRNPNFFEKYVASTNVLFGDEQLQPEKISSLELGMDWFLSPSISLRINGFSTSSDELIARAGLIPAGQMGNTRPTPRYANAAGQKIQGLEAENKGVLGKGLSYFLNVSLLKGKEKLDDSDIQFIPKVLANAGLTVRLGEPWSLSAYVQHVGKKEGRMADTAKTPNSVDAYQLMHLNVEYRPKASLLLGLAIRNAFDKTWAYPEYIRKLVPTTPGGPDRSITAKVAYMF